MSVEVVQSPIAAPTQRPRGRAGAVTIVALVLLVLALVVTTALLAARVLAPVPSSPAVFGADDALPTNLQPGKQYTAELVVALPADWASYAEAQDGADIWVLGVVTSTEYPDGSILCSDGGKVGAAIRISCPITAPAEPGPLTITVVVGDVFGLDGENSVSNEHTYTHTVG